MQLRDVVQRLLAARRTGDLVILVGAGVSRDAPSNLPLWDDLNRAVINHFCIPHLPRHWAHEVQKFAELLRPEVILQLGLDTFGRAILGVLDSLRSTAFNANHARIILLSDHGNPIVTTNLDVLFESAAAQLGRRLAVCTTESDFRKADGVPGGGTLFKVHGSISLDLLSPDNDSLIASLDQVGSGFSCRKRRVLKTVMQNRALLVLGYYGADHFDMMPLLLELAPALSFVVWVNHGSSYPVLVSHKDDHVVLHPLAERFTSRARDKHVVFGNTHEVLKLLVDEEPDVRSGGIDPPSPASDLASIANPSARATLLVGSMCEVIGQPVFGAACLGEFLTFTKEIDPVLKEELTSMRGRLLEEAGNLDEAQSALVSVDVALLSVASRIRHRIRQGNLENRRGSPGTARAAYLLALAEAPPGSDLQHACLHALGVCLIFEGRADEAVAHYRSFVPKMFRAGDVRTRLAALNNLGAALYLRGDPVKAAHWLKLALIDAEFVNYPTRQANILDALGLVELDLGRTLEAVSHLNRARHIRNGVGAALERSISLVNLGDALLVADRYKAALAAHSEAKRIRDTEMAGRDSAIPTLGVARALALLGRSKEAADILAEPMTEASSEVERARGRLHRAVLLLHLGRHEEAVALLRSSAPFPQRTHDLIAAALLRAANPRQLERCLLTAAQSAALKMKRGERAELTAHLKLIRDRRRLG